METKFEAAYLRDEKFEKEFTCYHSYRRPFGVTFTVICTLAILSGCLNLFVYNKYWSIISIVLGIYLLVLRMIRVKKSMKLSLERDKESNHGNLVWVQNYVTENSITVKSSLNEAGVEYDISCIKKVYRSKNYIYLVTKAKLAIVFDIHNFSKGTPEELMEFVRQKGIKTK